MCVDPVAQTERQNIKESKFGNSQFPISSVLTVQPIQLMPLILRERFLKIQSGAAET
jgi:hypothetical protein